MKWLLLVILIFIGLFHIPFPRGEIQPFPFSKAIDRWEVVDGEAVLVHYNTIPIPIQTYVYFISQHLVLILFTWGWLHECSKEMDFPLRVFVLLQVGDLCDFLLSYNSEYLTGFPYSYNVFMVISFSILMIYHDFTRSE